MKTKIIISIIIGAGILSWAGKMIVRENLIGIDEGNMWPPENQNAPIAPGFPFFMFTQDL